MMLSINCYTEMAESELFSVRSASLLILGYSVHYKTISIFIFIMYESKVLLSPSIVLPLAGAYGDAGVLV